MGANPSGARPENLLPGVSNYFLGGDPRGWRAGVPHYQRVRYQEVYPGVDLVYTARAANSNTTFWWRRAQIPRGSNELDGASSVRIDAAGDLRIAVPGGEVVHRRPLSFEVEDGARRRVASAYRILGERAVLFVTFDIGRRNPRRPLVIDPVLNFRHLFGGSNDPEQISAMVVDGAGSIYIAGHTTSNNFPVSGGAAQGAPGWRLRCLRHQAEFDRHGGAVYSTYLGGASIEEVHALRVDAAGNTFVTGATGSADFPTTAGAGTTHGGNQDVFVRN